MAIIWVPDPPTPAWIYLHDMDRNTDTRSKES